MDVQALVGTTGAGTAAGAIPASASSSPAAAPPAATERPPLLGETQKHALGIAPAIAKIFGSSDDKHTVPAVTVSYKIEGKTIHTVFTDPATGQEIAQFPPDLLAHIASFFDHEQGVTLDKNA